MNEDRDLEDVWVVSIHDRAPEGYLAMDVSEIVECISPAAGDYRWIAFDLDVTGEPVEAGKPMSTSELQSLSRKLRQTVGGKLLAYAGACPDLEMARMDYSTFPDSPARLAIVAVDSSYFEVYAKDSDVVRRLRERFGDVRDENPCMYFADW